MSAGACVLLIDGGPCSTVEERVCLIGSGDWSEADPHGDHAPPDRHGPDCRCGCARPEPGSPRGPHLVSRADCPNGCARRDLKSERSRGIDRVCLRCLTWTWDAPGWEIPPQGIHAERWDYAAAERRSEAFRLRSLGWSYRKIALKFEVDRQTAWRWVRRELEWRGSFDHPDRHDAPPAPTPPVAELIAEHKLTRRERRARRHPRPTIPQAESRSCSS